MNTVRNGKSAIGTFARYVGGMTAEGYCIVRDALSVYIKSVSEADMSASTESHSLNRVDASYNADIVSAPEAYEEAIAPM